MAVKHNFLSSINVTGPIPAHLARSVIEETLRNAILDGRLPSGTAMRQQALAVLFGVSRMPVREALRQLEAQGLLHVVQHKGAVVAPLIEDDALQTYELRLLLEAHALRLSLPLLSEDDYQEAANCIEALESETDVSKIGALNRHFHQTLYGKAPNKKLLAMIEAGLVEEERFLRFNLDPMSLGTLCQDDHRALLRHALNRDIEASIAELTTHLQHGVEAVAEYLKSQKLKQP